VRGVRVVREAVLVLCGQLLCLLGVLHMMLMLTMKPGCLSGNYLPLSSRSCFLSYPHRYEFVRAASMTMFTGIFGAEHLPMALAVVPVVTMGMLAVYHRMIHAVGPRMTLLGTTLLCALVLATTGLVLCCQSESDDAAPSLASMVAVFTLFVFR